MQTEDRQIIHQCLNGDTAMFGFLVDKYKEGVYALAYSRLHNFHDAQDVAQEAFIKAYRKLHTLRHWDNFALWLSAITNNLCKNFIRSKSNRPDREFFDEQSQEIIDHTSVDSYRDNLADESLKESLNSLPEIYRQVLVLHYLSGYTSMDMAHLLGISIRTVAERLRIGRERLKEEMVNMMSATLKEQRLPAGFTFRIVEMVKRIRIHPATRSNDLPYGLSLATGIIIAVLCLSPYVPWLNQMDTPTGSPLPLETKVLKAGEIPVDILKTSQITVISSKVEKGKGGGAKKVDIQNTVFTAPKAENGQWARKTDMPTGRTMAFSCELNGKIYVFGGGNNLLAPAFKDVEEYDPAADKWIKKGDMPNGFGASAACALNGKIYVVSGVETPAINTLGDIKEYDPIADKWIKKSEMPFPRYLHTVCVLDGNIYVIGGRSAAGYLKDAYKYDPLTDTWTKIPNMSFSREGIQANVVNGKIYVIGGYNETGALSVVEEYDPVSNVWTRKKDMPSPRGYLGACVIDNLIYVIGGIINLTTSTQVVEVYDPATDTWSKGLDMLTPRFEYCTNSVDGKIYVIGGSEQYVGFPNPTAPVLSLVEAYDIGKPSIINQQGKLPTTWGESKEINRR